MNQIETKIQLFNQQNQLHKQLKNKKDMIATVRRSYYQNKKIAQEQMELINQLTVAQNSYYETISLPPPIQDSKVSQYHHYRYLIDDLGKSYNEEEDSELAFPFDEVITPDIDHYSDLYNQLDDWIKTKEIIIEEGDEQQKNIKKEIKKLRDQNLKLKEFIEREPDISEQILEIKNLIKEKKSILNSKDEITSLYQQKQNELKAIYETISSSQINNSEEIEENDEDNKNSENDDDENIRLDKEVNVLTLNKLQLRYLEKWSKLKRLKIEQQIQAEKNIAFMNNVKSLIG